MNRQQRLFDETELPRLRSGAIDYAAYDLRARKERSKAFRAAARAVAECVGSGLSRISGALAGIVKTALQGARNCDPAGLQASRSCPTPLNS